MRVRGLKPAQLRNGQPGRHVAPYAGAWIETACSARFRQLWQSHPMRVRGLKPPRCLTARRPRTSHPMRVRGLKLRRAREHVDTLAVAPYAGAWIETPRACGSRSARAVAPYAGAWIETGLARRSTCSRGSHPMRVRGLKPVVVLAGKPEGRVAPYAGAWIETLWPCSPPAPRVRRTLCGCVD